MNIKNIFYKYFKDCYGWDKFSSFLVIIALVFTASRWIILMLIGTALMLWAIWRSLSKNRYKRYQEEEAFEYTLSRFNYKIRGLRDKFSEKLHYRILTCPNCSQKLRVPRHKGKITVICKKCSAEFKTRS